MIGHCVSERGACAVLRFGRSTHRYTSRRDRQEFLRMRLKDLASVRVHYGYRRLYVLLRREGWKVNHKRVYRLYSEENLTMRIRKPRRRRSAAQRVARPDATAPDQCWSMDFVADALADGRRFRALTIVDNFSRESPAIEVGASMTGQQVVKILDRLARSGRCPRFITVDNGSEFISKALDQWAHWRGVQLDFIHPGKPVENAYIESFNGRFRSECLNAHWFHSIDEARLGIESWRREYNGFRPHSSLKDQTPEEFLRKHSQPGSCEKPETLTL